MHNLSIKLYHICACYTNIMLYDVIYSIQYYPRFSVTAVGLGTYYLWIRWSTCISRQELCDMSRNIFRCEACLEEGSQHWRRFYEISLVKVHRKNSLQILGRSRLHMIKLMQQLSCSGAWWVGCSVLQTQLLLIVIMWEYYSTSTMCSLRYLITFKILVWRILHLQTNLWAGTMQAV